jgi:hypothetical protein
MLRLETQAFKGFLHPAGHQLPRLDATKRQIPDIMTQSRTAFLEPGGGALDGSGYVGCVAGQIRQPRVGCQNREHFLRIRLPIGCHAEYSLRS